MNFTMTKESARHINNIADLMAHDLNHESRQTPIYLDNLKENESPEYAIWIIDKVQSLMFSE